jgi:hypothetical protein
MKRRYGLTRIMQMQGSGLKMPDEKEGGSMGKQKKCISFKECISNLFKKKSYPILNDSEYNEMFGIESLENKEPVKNEKKKRLKAAFEKAWEVRNFEIEKFWQRSAYFWGFIALIFGGYVSIVTGESSVIANKMYLDLYLILLGIIFSFGWLLVIRGSKRWQENWEEHIDKLEDEITGPLYKIIYCAPNKKFYSVSKINEILAIVVIKVWILLLARYVYDNYIYFKKILECPKQNIETILFMVLPVVFTFICIVFLFSKKAQTSIGKYKIKKTEGFINRKATSSVYVR